MKNRLPSVQGLSFETGRLSVEDWKSALQDTAKKRSLERAIEPMLTPQVTHYLPPSMQFPGEHRTISDWVSGLSEESEVLSIFSRDEKCLLGLAFLSPLQLDTSPASIHIGYFFGEAFWGKGYASEMVAALVQEFSKGAPVLLLAYTDSDNLASAQILKKAGFEKDSSGSTESRFFFQCLIA